MSRHTYSPIGQALRLAERDWRRERIRRGGLVAAFAAALILALTGCATGPIAGHPHLMREVLAPVDYTRTVVGWTLVIHPVQSHCVSKVANTHSMEPFIMGGDMALGEAPGPDTVYKPGMVVIYDRGDVHNVIHEVDAVSKDGKWLYIYGLNCPAADGWFSVSKVKFVIGRVVALSPR